MDKLKQYLGYAVAAITALIGVLLYFLSRKRSEVEELHSEIALAKTEKEADVLEVQIKDLKSNKDNLDKHNQELDKTLEKLEVRRTEIKEETKNLKNPNDIANYWEHN